MKLIEALKIANAPRPASSRPLDIALVCGFSPLHLQTFLTAELRERMPDRMPELSAGLYGDFWGNLARLKGRIRDGIVIFLEWSDLDPRLGLRSLGGWTLSVLDESIQTAEQRANQLEASVLTLAKQSLIVVSLPTLPLPPIAVTPGWQASRLELQLRSELADLAVRLATIQNVRIVNQQRLDEVSPLADRLDVGSDIAAGFPYRLGHASSLAALVSCLLVGKGPKKGLITDLDDTLWSGLVGEVGSQGVSWDLDHRTHIHGLYQQFLRSLSKAGVFIAVASKNDAALVDEAFRREDILLPQDCVFPMDVSWGAKSRAVGRIAKAWNVGFDSIVFVDDSAAEVAEVKSAYPEVECLTFPSAEPQRVLELIWRLRDLFGKERISAEDGIRTQSTRLSADLLENIDPSSASTEAFLRQTQAELTYDFAKEPLDPRALELINKTNQFNLNGRRYGIAEWINYVSDPDVFLLLVSYRDKYGPLGKIAAITGRQQNRTLLIENWVMSCRAFSRRIEYACLEALYDKFDADEMEADFVATPRNGPIRTFFEDIFRTLPAHGRRLSRREFLENRRETSHLVGEIRHG